MSASFDRAFIFPILVPYSTSVSVDRRPWGTYALIVATITAFLAILRNGELLDLYALQPNGPKFQYLTYAFMHEQHPLGVVHMALSLYFLWIFGSALESKVRWWGIIPLYLLSAAAGGLAHTTIYDDAAPLVGASAAVFGVMGAFVILHPYAMVRCFFVLLILFVPLLPKRTEIMALYFIVLYAVILALFPLLGMIFSLVLNLESISQPAHVGGFLAGVALAVLRYGFYGFSAEAEEDAAAEKRLQRKLGHAVLPGGMDQTDSSIFSLKDIRRGDVVSKAVRPIHENLIMGDKQRAREEFAKLIPFDPNACLPPPSQIDLARILEEMNDNELAVEAYDRLLRAFPDHAVSVLAKLELARLLTRLNLRPEDTERYLREFLATNPAPDLEREAYRVMRHGEGRIGIQVSATSTLFGDKAQVPPSQPFGDPNDTNQSFDMSLGAPPPVPASVPYNAWEPSMPDPTPGTLHFTPGMIDPERMDDYTPEAFSIDVPDLYQSDPDSKAQPQSSDPAPSPAASAEPPPTAHKAAAPSPAVTPSEEHPEHAEPTPPSQYPGMPSDADYTLGLADSGHNRRVAQLRHSDFERARAECHLFALILPPSLPVDVRVIVHVLAPAMGMKKNAAHHALLRRRGVLADDLPFEQVEPLAHALAARGQSVSIIAKGASWAFRQPCDVLSMRIAGDYGEFGTDDGNLIRIAWVDIVCIGAGMVHLSPDAPPRALLDIFVARSGHHLRIWENSFVFGSRSAAEHRFADLAHTLADHTPQAILTRAVQSWLNSNAAHPAADFASLIEYENALDWHLMAYFSPRLEVPAQKN